MPEIESEIVFHIHPSNMIFHQLTDGDTLVLNGLEITKEQAATLSWLGGHSDAGQLRVEIRIVEE
jgi:hypothetical protein